VSAADRRSAVARRARTLSAGVPPLIWKFFRVRAVAFGGGLLALFVLAVLLGPTFVHVSPVAIDVAHAFAPPGREHPLGTDDFGRDILSRVLYGGRLSLGAGVTAVLLATSVGTVLGLVFGFYGRLIDGLGMRFLDVMMAFPNLLLALAVIAALGTGIRNTIVAVGITFVPLVTRMVRSSVLSVASAEYVLAARSVGCNDGRIIVGHVLRNVLPTIIVTATLVFGFAVLSVSALSFIGLAVRPPTPELGAMLSDARAYMNMAWWTAAGPGAALMLLILSINILGDGLRHILDPGLRY
jgi:peptide/nickel transport system permease protein